MKTERVQKNKRKERIILRCERKGREETKRKNERDKSIHFNLFHDLIIINLFFTASKVSDCYPMIDVSESNMAANLIRSRESQETNDQKQGKIVQ